MQQQWRAEEESGGRREEGGGRRSVGRTSSGSSIAGVAFKQGRDDAMPAVCVEMEILEKLEKVKPNAKVPKRGAKISISKQEKQWWHEQEEKRELESRRGEGEKVGGAEEVAEKTGVEEGTVGKAGEEVER